MGTAAKKRLANPEQDRLTDEKGNRVSINTLINLAEEYYSRESSTLFQQILRYNVPFVCSRFWVIWDRRLKEEDP